MNTYVLVGGAWIGAWAWETVAARLWAAGHDVYPLSLTGLGERSHLGGPEVDLDTHITDVTRLIEFEDLHDVILVGHSYAGVVIPGVADRIPERIARLVYLDSGPLTDAVALMDTRHTHIHLPMPARELAQILAGLRTVGPSRDDSEFESHFVGSRML